ncbi:hypothetical protein CSV86_002315 [Pseudomonas putida CSV86]|uniref:Transcription factor LuxR-like autoinducer-binding domain-containing protein n=1 Tax=Pseudomonas bharatica CSV86 TaxID=1005395 RepID=A0A7K4E938_9PSED|nr:autoinducer binding domain-containing protein [Pseudomonas bharatica]NNJ14176.1 hypothetical protein [Pseudomonas bharatica CSV86]
MRPTPDFMHWWLEANARFDDCHTPDELFEETARLTRALDFQRFAWGRRRPLPFSQARGQFTGTYPAAWLADQDQFPPQACCSGTTRPTPPGACATSASPAEPPSPSVVATVAGTCSASPVRKARSKPASCCP